MYKIKLRGDTKARWESANPVLALREVGLETDTKKLKIGDGISVYSALMYAGGNIQSLVEGEGITIDYTDPANPIISSTGGGSSEFYIGDTPPIDPSVNLWVDTSSSSTPVILKK